MRMKETEILSAEVFLDSLGRKVDTRDIDAELERVNQELQAYRCDAGMEDYAIAVLCGILAGAVDAFVLKQTDITKETVTAAPEQLLTCLKQKTRENKPKTKKTVPHATIEKDGLDVIPELEQLSQSTTAVGLVATLLCQFRTSGMLRYDGEKLHLLPDDMSRSSGVWIAGTAVVAAVMKWLFNATSQEVLPEGSLKTLDKLRKVLHASPAMAGIVKCVDEWQTRLPGEMKDYRKTMKEDMGIDAIFLSLFKEIVALPSMKGTQLAKVIEKYRRAENKGITAIPLVKALSQQAAPVILNEILVRAAYFTVRLARELEAHEDVDDIEWENVMPFGNRTIERMIAVASVTFSVADTTDALVHAIIESAGNHTLFGASFVKRFNIVGFSRAAVAVYRDVSLEREEAERLQEKRMLMEAKAERILEQLEAYKQQLEKRVTEYIADDISAFLTGFRFMDQGLVSGDSDLVIKGNVVIQRVMGREPQFTNQAEFDDLMDSDIPLKL